MIEVANGDYGDFVDLLATAANRSDCRFLKNNSANNDPNEDAPVIRVDGLGYADSPLLKKPGKNDTKDVITVPSEWSKFWTLVARCHVHYYRDWVSEAANCIGRDEKN